MTRRSTCSPRPSPAGSRAPATCSSATRGAPPRSWKRPRGSSRYRSKAEAIVQGNLALAFIGQSRVDEAAAALHKAIDVIEVTWGGGGLNVVFTAARQLRRWQRLSVVRDVSDRLLALMAAS